MAEKGLHRVVRELVEEIFIEGVKEREGGFVSVDVLKEIVELLRGVFFPGYFGSFNLSSGLTHQIESKLEVLYKLLSEQVRRSFCFECLEPKNCDLCTLKAQKVTWRFITLLPQIKKVLLTDVEAAYLGDPAAKNRSEVIFCYPSLRALINYRVAHVLYQFGIPLIPRILTEIAHSETGIDIHPGAQIGTHFFMDHGTGIVIGETTIIGNRVRIYQGVTLGAKSFPLDENGNPVKGIPRHPIVEDDVIIYAGATILGRIRIGRGSIIGGNVWITEDVPPGSKVFQNRVRYESYSEGGNIRCEDE